MIDVLVQFRFFHPIAFALLALWLITIGDILLSKHERKNKIMWILIVLFLPGLGAILYLIIGRYSQDD